jgi:hypothetical protein
VIASDNLGEVLRIHSGGHRPEQELARCNGKLAALGERGFIPACRCPFCINDRTSRGSVIDGLCSLVNNPDEADAFAWNRADQPLLVAIVVNCGPRRIDAGGKRRL